MPRPQQAQGRIFGARRDLRHVERLRVFPFAADAAQRQRPVRLAAPFAEIHHRPFREHVRHARRLDVVHFKTLRVQFHLRQHRRLNVLPEFFGLRRGFARIQQHERLAHADPRHAFDEEAVDRRADAEREQIGVAEFAANQVKHLRLDVDVAVGDDDDAARHAFGARQRKGALHGGQNLRSAAALLIADKLQRLLDILRRGGQRGVFGQHGGIAGKEQHVKLFIRVQLANQIAQQLFRNVERKAAH